MITVAIDIGGTFTDLVGFDDKAGKFVDCSLESVSAAAASVGVRSWAWARSRWGTFRATASSWAARDES